MKDTSQLVVEILEYATTFDELLILEEIYLQEHCNLYNNMNFNNRPVGFATGDLNWATTADGRERKRKGRLGKSFDDLYGIERSAEIRNKISESRTGQTRDSAWNTGLTKDTDARLQLSAEKTSASVQAWMDSMTPEQRKQKFGNYGEKNGFYNKSHSEETKLKISQSAKNRPIIECVHCGKKTTAGNHTRWHGNNCKLNA